jgi:transcriptional regulator with XRE-family HTH domain
MKMVAFILDKMGISQRNLANFVGTAQSLISRSEAATRNIPPDANIQLINIYTILSKLHPPSSAKPTEEEKAYCQQQAEWCLAQCHPLQKQLAAMQANYQQADTMPQFLNVYTEQHTALNDKKQRWVDEQRYQAEKKLAANGWLAQQQLQLKLALLQYEANWYQQALL